VLVKLEHVGSFIVYFNVNFNILKQIDCALVGLVKDWITSECIIQLWGGGMAMCSRWYTQNIHIVTTEIKAFDPFSIKGCISVYSCQVSLVRR
jgi:hypothetical protein